MFSSGLGGLDDEPTGMGAALFGDAAVIAVITGLVGGRNQTEISGSFVGGSKAVDVTEGGQQAFSGAEVEAGKRHQKLDLWILIGVGGALIGDGGDLLLQSVEEAQLAVDGGAAFRIQSRRRVTEPSQILDGEQIALGGFDQALMEEGVDAVLDASPVADEHRTPGGALAEEPRIGGRDPDVGKVVDAKELSQNLSIDLVGFDFGLSDGLGAERIADDHFLDQGLEDGDDGPCVSGGFRCNRIVLGAVLPHEGFDDGASGEEALRESDFISVVDDDGLDFFLVDIETTKWHTEFVPFLTVQGQPMGEQTGHRN